MKRIIDKSDGRIWIRVPKSYGNPVVEKDDHHRRLMLEHRYIMERYFAKHLELAIAQKCLIDEKYLKPECEVHHINLDCQDNRKENLWVYENNKKHKRARKSLYGLINELLTSKKVIFEKCQYFLNSLYSK